MNRASDQGEAHHTATRHKLGGSAHHAKIPLDELPSAGVSSYVERLAQLHRIDATPSRLDEWAEAVTRAGGDEVQLDRTARLLVALKRQRLIDGRQLARLLACHLLEGADARSAPATAAGTAVQPAERVRARLRG